ncbi:MAG: hypothetical protein QNJ51_31085 [Calothrix sp. MO_167.B12]|nr:hypothetical protein [Calothrix sp. MO_167.B12]
MLPLTAIANIHTGEEFIRFLAGENFNNQIVRGILRQNLNIDIVRVQDVDLSDL